MPSLTEQALALSGSVWAQDSLLSSTALDQAPCVSTQTFAVEASLLDSSKSAIQPSWLTPQQLQNRQLGMSCILTRHWQLDTASLAFSCARSQSH